MNDELRRQLIEAAIKVRDNAYAPYSKFKVGSALVTEDGAIFDGCNIENSSFGLTICAERVAIGNAVAAGKKSFQGICVVSEGGAAPCGACRQFINEFDNEMAILLVDAATGQVSQETTLKELLPHSFSL